MTTKVDHNAERQDQEQADHDHEQAMSKWTKHKAKLVDQAVLEAVRSLCESVNGETFQAIYRWIEKTHPPAYTAEKPVRRQSIREARELAEYQERRAKSQAALAVCQPIIDAAMRDGGEKIMCLTRGRFNKRFATFTDEEREHAFTYYTTLDHVKGGVEYDYDLDAEKWRIA